MTPSYEAFDVPGENSCLSVPVVRSTMATGWVVKFDCPEPVFRTAAVLAVLAAWVRVPHFHALTIAQTTSVRTAPATASAA